MPFPARGENVKLGKGSLLMALLDANDDENGFDFAGNATSVAISSEITTQELYSSTEKTGALIDRARTRVKYTLTVGGLNEFTLFNLKMFLAGTDNAKSQGSDASVDKTLTNVKVGKYYDLGARRITGVTAVNGSDPLVSGTDYELNAEFGIFRILPDSILVADDDDPVVSFSQPALTIDQVRIARSGANVCHLLYLADDANSQGDAAKDRLEVWRVDVAPDGEMNLISEDYGAFSLTMAILSDATNHPNDPYGTLDRIAAA
jgi:hypothetical protein